MKLDVIIVKQTVSEGFFIMMRGHKPNPLFKSFVSERIPTYKEVYRLALTVENALSLAGHAIKVYNDSYAESDGREWCELMAFQPFETLRD